MFHGIMVPLWHHNVNLRTGWDSDLRSIVSGACSIGIMNGPATNGRRWLAVRFERAKTWDNPPCPCIHSDPTFPDLAPGEEAVVRGRVWFHEGDEPPR